MTYLRSDWTKYVCSCPAASEAALQAALKAPLSDTNDIESCKLPPGTTINWKVRPKPAVAQQVSMKS